MNNLKPEGQWALPSEIRNEEKPMNETDVKKDDNIIDLKSAGDAIRKKKECDSSHPSERCFYFPSS